MEVGDDHGPFLVDDTWIMEGERLCSLMYSPRKKSMSSSMKIAVVLVVLWMIKYMLLT